MPIFEISGKPVVVTKCAMDEMCFEDVDMFGALEILKEGFCCSRSRRKGNVIERCLHKGSKTIKVVAVDMGGYIKIIRAGSFGRKNATWENEAGL